MENIYIEKKIFENVDFQENILKKGEYEKCDFKNCNFYKSDISDIVFVDCTFVNCNLSIVKKFNNN